MTDQLIDRLGDLAAPLRALRAPFEVIYSPRWLERLSAGQGVVCSPDLIILHPSYGALVCVVERLTGLDGVPLEGGALRRDELGGDAIERAFKLRHCLGDLLKRCAPTLELCYAGAAIFPDVYVEGAARFINGEAFMIDRGGLNDLAASLEAVYQKENRVWVHGAARLEEARSLLRALSSEQTSEAPRLELIYHDAKVIGALSEQQAYTYEWALGGQRRTATSGAAGTGKTEVALYMARRAAREGLNVLLLCFNVALRVTLERRLAHDQYPLEGRVNAQSIHRLVDRLASEVRLPPPSGSLEDQELLADTLLEVSRRRASLNPQLLFDVIVVDEGQDLQMSWLTELIEATLKEPSSGRVHVFYDERQRLTQEREGALTSAALKAEGFSFAPPLKVNYRNARLVATAAAQVWEEGGEVPDETPEGQPVAVRLGGLPEVQRRLNELTQGGLSLADIVVLSPHKSGGGCEGLSSPQGATLNSGVTHDAVERWLNGEGLLLTTPHKFKGLEAKVALIVDLSERALDSAWFGERALYVSITRGASLVELFTKDLATYKRLKALNSKI